MQKLTIAALAVASLLSVAPAIAQDASSGTNNSSGMNAGQNENGAPEFATLDSDKNGELSFAEVTSALTSMTQADFDTADADKSGGLNLSEYAAIQNK